MITQTPAKIFQSASVTAVTVFETEPVQTSMLLKYFIITNNSAGATAVISLYLEDTNGTRTRICPLITLQSSTTAYNVSLIESEGNIVIYPKYKVVLVVTSGDVSAVFSLTPAIAQYAPVS